MFVFGCLNWPHVSKWLQHNWYLCQRKWEKISSQIILEKIEKKGFEEKKIIWKFVDYKIKWCLVTHTRLPDCLFSSFLSFNFAFSILSATTRALNESIMCQRKRAKAKKKKKMNEIFHSARLKTYSPVCVFDTQEWWTIPSGAAISWFVYAHSMHLSKKKAIIEFILLPNKCANTFAIDIRCMDTRMSNFSYLCRSLWTNVHFVTAKIQINMQMRMKGTREKMVEHYSK